MVQSPPDAQGYQYYVNIGANFDSSTLEAFKATNQLVNPGIRAFYFNNGDLQLGREMHCTQQGTQQVPRFACYVSNYGPQPWPVGTLDNNTTYPNSAQALAEVEGVAQNASPSPHPFATVAMVSLSVPPTAIVTVKESDGRTANLNPPKFCGANYNGNSPPSNADVDTGLDIETGDTITYIANGVIWTGYCIYGANSPDGLAWTENNNPDYPLPTAHDSELIGRIGNGTYFEIGSSKIQKYLGQRGRLFLRTNDNNPGNGVGAFAVTVVVQRHQLVRFYVYGPADHTCILNGGTVDHCSSLSTFAALDREGPKSVPQMCMACHGGTYNSMTDEAVGSAFLPFDLANFLYSQKSGLTLNDQQEQFRELNSLVRQTNSNPSNLHSPIQDLIDAFYGNQVDTPGTKALSPQDQAIPGTPPGHSNDSSNPWYQHEELYRTFVRPYCRSCHISESTPYDFYSYDTFETLPIGSAVGNDLCSGKMPNAQVPYTALAGAKLDPKAAKDLFALGGLNCLIDQPFVPFPIHKLH